MHDQRVRPEFNEVRLRERTDDLVEVHLEQRQQLVLVMFPVATTSSRYGDPDNK